MGSVRNPWRRAWVPFGPDLRLFPGVSLRSARACLRPGRHLTEACANGPPAACPTPPGRAAGQVAHTGNAKEGVVWDLFYIGLTIVVFAALWLLLKGVERFER